MWQARSIGPNMEWGWKSNEVQIPGTKNALYKAFLDSLLCTYDHDFNSFAEGVIIPHSLYDIQRNVGYIQLGTSHDTSEFACDSFRRWWYSYGCFHYPNATSILVLCDGGGSNNSRHYFFKQDLQALVDEIGVEIRIAHYPPYCSKYNPIEHRLFPHVTRACQGVSIEVAQILLFFRVHTDNRIPRRCLCSFKTQNVFTLRLAIGHLFHRLLLLRLTQTIAVLRQQFAYHRLADFPPMVLVQRFDHLFHRQIGPAYGCIHRVARGMVTENVQKFLVDVDPGLLIRFAAAAGFPNASIHFGRGQLADSFGAFAHRPTTTAQHPGNVTAATVPILQRLDTGIKTSVFFGQPLGKSLHTLFDFLRVRLHVRIPSGARLTTFAWHMKDTRSSFIRPHGYVIKFSFLRV